MRHHRLPSRVEDEAGFFCLVGVDSQFGCLAPKLSVSSNVIYVSGMTPDAYCPLAFFARSQSNDMKRFVAPFSS